MLQQGMLTVWIVAAMAIATCPGALAAKPLPAATNLVLRMIDRSRAVAQSDATNQCTYQKRSVTAQLDERDKVIKTEEKHYTVTVVNGLPFNRLTQVKGRDLTEKELERENQREEAFRKKVTGVDVKTKAKRKEAVATRDVMNRFEFTVVKREPRNGRDALLLTFTPKKSGAPEKSIADKLLNRFTGAVWVDEEEAEMLSVDAKLSTPVTIGWFGAIGSLQKCHIQFERLRLANGLWVNRSSAVEIVGRQLLETMRFRNTEESSGFVVAE